jgi:DNA invertase Pin-like site-specific DNA recombinase
MAETKIAAETELNEISDLTKQMRLHEAAVVDLGKQRRVILRDLRKQNIPYRLLAEAMGTSEQAVYKDLRWGK